MSSRRLELLEARKLSDLARSQEPRFGGIWPGSRNMRLIAEAVNNRRDHVELDSGRLARLFTIKYDNVAEAVFIKPAEGNYVPCGWFSYNELKRILKVAGVVSE